MSGTLIRSSRYYQGHGFDKSLCFIEFEALQGSDEQPWDHSWCWYYKIPINHLLLPLEKEIRRKHLYKWVLYHSLLSMVTFWHFLKIKPQVCVVGVETGQEGGGKTQGVIAEGNHEWINPPLLFSRVLGLRKPLWSSQARLGPLNCFQ